MTGIGGTPPLSPRKPPTSSQSDPPKPRALEVTKTSPRTNFPVLKVDAVRRKQEEKKEKEIIEHLRLYENEEFKIVIQSTLEERKTEPEIETVQVVASPRGEFESKRSFFENLSKGNTPTTAPTHSPALSPRPLPPLPLGGLPSQEGAITPRREAKAVLPPLTPRESEKQT